jgi:hypothetical protein
MEVRNEFGWGQDGIKWQTLANKATSLLVSWKAGIFLTS